jgi:hypothetical protein
VTNHRPGRFDLGAIVPSAFFDHLTIHRDLQNRRADGRPLDRESLRVGVAEATSRSRGAGASVRRGLALPYRARDRSTAGTCPELAS